MEEIEKAGLNYFERMAEYIKSQFPEVWQAFHLSARGYAGGKAKAEALAAEPEAVEEATVKKANPTTDDVSTERAVEVESVKCPKCGKMVTPKDGKCPECGADMSEPAQKSEDDRLEPIAKDEYATIAKADAAQQKVWSVVLEPWKVDSQGDWITPAEIEKAAHNWLENYGKHGLSHKGAPNPQIRPVESYIAPADFMLGEQPVTKGSWVVGTHILDADIWQRVEKGELNGFSIQGFGKRKQRTLKEAVTNDPFAVSKAGARAFFTDEDGKVHPMGGKGIVPSAAWGKMTPEERAKAKEEAKGKEEEKFEGLGAFEQDGTASEKQVAYIQSLVNKPDWIIDDANGARSEGHRAVAIREVTNMVSAGTRQGVDCISSDSSESARNILGKAVAVKAKQWAQQTDWKKLSSRGASSVIDSLKGGGGVVRGFLAAFGGKTVEERAAFIRRVSNVKTRIEPGIKDYQFIVLED